MRHQLLLLLSVGLVIFFALMNVDAPSITGAFLVKETETTYAVKLHHIVNKFFGVAGLQFPAGSCGDIAEQLYANIAAQGLDETSGTITSGNSKLATISFDIDQIDTFGTLDMVKGPVLMDGNPEDSFISISAESIVRVPKEIKTTYYFLDIYGMSDGLFHVTHGSFSTPSVDCTFKSQAGQAVCDCNVHRVSGIRTGGITALRPLPE